jgi:2-dehydropantoate 2-reductase
VRITIAGVGGVGGAIGARLAAAGHDVSFLARGRNLAAIRDTGLVLDSPQGTVRLGPQRASDDARELGAVDAVVVAVKVYDLADLAPRLAPLVAAETAVLPLQNGVEAHSILAAAAPAPNILKGTVQIKASLVDPGHVVCESPGCRIRLAEANGVRSQRVERLATALAGCVALDAAVADDIDAELWRKFVMLASFAAVCSLARAPIRRVAEDPDARALLLEAAAEGMAVARARGVALADDLDGLVIAPTRRLPPDARPSMLEDLEAGRRLELPYLSCAMVRFGRAAGVATPVHSVAARALAMHAGGRPKDFGPAT